MFDFIPVRVWILLALFFLATGPLIYIWHYLRHDAAPRDITLPPPDLSWRSTRQLYRNLAMLAGLLLLGAFIYTPQAENFASSDYLLPTMLGAVGSYSVGTVIKGWRDRTIEPFIRGLSSSFNRDEQPRRFWASVVWNAAFGSALIVGSVKITHSATIPNCHEPKEHFALGTALRECNELVADQTIQGEERSDILATRGRIFHRLGNNERALADYSMALKLDADDSYTLYNRGIIHSRLDDFPRAIEDFTASLALRPDNDDGYLKRGNAYLGLGLLDMAIQDYDTLLDKNPENNLVRAKRGMANVWKGDRKAAERDLTGIVEGDEGWPAVLHARAAIAWNDKDYRRVVDFLTESIAIDGDDEFALRVRADAYWKLGQKDLARADDDRSIALELERNPSARSIAIPVTSE